MTNALFFGHATSNVGDVALNMGATRLFEAAGERLDHVAFPPTSPHWLQRGRESFDECVAMIELRRDAMSSDALREYCEHPERLFAHYGLGGVDTVLIHSGEHFYAPRSIADLHALALWRILPALAAKATGRRLIVLPSTFGPFEHRGLTRGIHAVISTADAAAAREPLSARAISRLVGREIPALLDPAFFLTGPRSLISRSAGSRVAGVMRLELTGLRTGAQKSALLLDQTRTAGYASTIATRMMVELGRQLDAGDLLAVLVQAASDDELASEAEPELRRTAHAEVEVRRMFDDGVLTYQDELATHDVVIASRFHACVLALAREIPAVGFSLAGHGHKIAGLYELLGLAEHAVAVPDAQSIAPAVKRIESMRTQSADLFAPVWPRLDELRSRTAEWLSEAMANPLRDTRATAQRGLSALAQTAKQRARVEEKLLWRVDADERRG